ncbi:MAG: NUDIX hydrolase [Aquisalimonadaceae bacterium]
MRPVTPLLAADCIIRLDGRSDRIVLIERANPPYGFAIPGGFVDVGETVEAAAIREAREEVGLNVHLRLMLGLYSAPDRDPRGHTASAVYIADAEGTPRADDDAAAVFILDPADRSLALAFDHRLILDDYLNWLETDRIAPPRP